MKSRLQSILAVTATLAGLAASANLGATVIFYSTPFAVSDVISTPVGDSFSGLLSGSQLLELPRFNWV